MKRIITLIFSVLILNVWAQTYNTTKITVPKAEIVKPIEVKPGFNASIRSVEAPSPDGDSYKSFLMRQKIKSRERFPRKPGVKGSNKTTLTDQPIIGRQTGMYRYFPNGSKQPVQGGVPNDNSMAISDGGILISGINSVIWAYDYNTDSTVFPYQVLSLENMAGGGGITDHFYDPKLIYDPDEDRFILVFLKNNSPSSSRIIVCFSSTNNPNDPWYTYEIPGNPLNNNRWTDYPAISLTEDELFITGNLIIPGVSWQVGFDGSVIWQINKNDGFSNAANLNTTLYSQIKYQGKYTRNVHPVRGAEGIAETQFFMSNRNFDILNDTLFVMHLTGNQDDPNTELIVHHAVSNTPYGMPPNGQQEDTDPANATGGLQTNDARVLGAFLHNNSIQYVGNSIDTSTGLAAFYHGFVTDPMTSPKIKSNIIGDSYRDFGYPNIAYTGNLSCDAQAIIGFDFTSVQDHPGIGAIFFDNDSNYSEMAILKSGESYVHRVSDPDFGNSDYERWGDYFGIQRKFNEPGKVYTTGFYGSSLHVNLTYVSELASPDTTIEMPQNDFPSKLFPNPTTDIVNIEFSLSTTQTVTAYLFDMSGREIGILKRKSDCIGKNVLTFSTYPLRNGTYVVKLYNESDQLILSEKIIKL